MEIPLLQTYTPIFGIILLGFVLRSSGFPGERFWPAAEQITYYILFPALLVLKISTAKTAGFDLWTLIAAVLCCFLLTSALLVLFGQKITRDGPAFTSVFQGTIRFNTYIGLTIILFALGDSGMLVAAVIMATLIPLVNVLCVAVLLRFGRKSGGSNGWGTLVVSILKNPIVIACVLGISLNFLQVKIISPLADFMAILGKAALPIGLLTVGAGLEFKVFQSARLTIAMACLMKLLVLPVLMFFSCRLFGVQTEAATVAILFAALPGSALSFILARQLGGDSRVMSGIITAQTCLSIVSMPLVLSLFNFFY
ncbi:MAG: AEC family transporter [Desulfobulbaceae bacterium]|nr:AEC family transporter [Desulfobulbaceae bacterium]